MADQREPFESFGGADAYRAIHAALSRALAEPAAQGTNAHGARAGFLLNQIAPEIQALRRAAVDQLFANAAVPPELLSLLSPYRDESLQAPNDRCCSQAVRGNICMTR